MLPHGRGRTVRVGVFATGASAEAAREAGAAWAAVLLSRRIVCVKMYSVCKNTKAVCVIRAAGKA